MPSPLHLPLRHFTTPARFLPGTLLVISLCFPSLQTPRLLAQTTPTNSSTPTSTPESPSSPVISFRSQIAPILQKHCLACHGPQKGEGDYRIDSFHNLSTSGESGEFPLTPHSPETSSLFTRIASQDEGIRMPADSPPLADTEILLLQTWIQQGALFDGSPNQSQVPLFELIPPATYPLPPHWPSVPITAMAFTPDSQKLILAGYHQIGIFPLDPSTPPQRITNVQERSTSIHLHPTQPFLIAAGGSPGLIGEVRCYSLADGALFKTLGRSHDLILNALPSPRGDWLALAGADNSLRIIDWDSGQELKNLSSHADAIYALATNQDGSRLASASRDKTAKVFNVQPWELLATYPEHAAPVRAILFDADGLSLFSGGHDKKIHRWSLDGPKRLSDIPADSELGIAAASTHYLAFTSQSNKLHLVDRRNGNLIKTLEGLPDWSTACCFSPDEKWLAAATWTGSIHLWQLSDLTPSTPWLPSQRLSPP